MGTYCHLRIGRLNLDAIKNGLGDYYHLFSIDDKGSAIYHYAENVTEEKPAFIRRLNRCVDGLKILGYSANRISEEFDEICKKNNLPFSHQKLQSLFQAIDIHTSIYDEKLEYLSDNELTTKIRNLLQSENPNPATADEIYEICSLIDQFGALEILALLSESNKFINEDIVWEYYDIIESGYITEEDLEDKFKSKHTITIITEGSSDSRILKRCFDFIYPDASRYFKFIDMEKNYPFTGTGNITNFYFGLCKINSTVPMIFIFDNDTAGTSALEKCRKMSNNSIVLMALPYSINFKSFPTIGPTGRSKDDINGKAVSIEMFLDLTYKSKECAVVRWTSYDEKALQYQGCLENKEHYAKRFFDACNSSDSNYKFDTLRFVLDSIMQNATELAPNRPLEGFIDYI